MVTRSSTRWQHSDWNWLVCSENKETTHEGSVELRRRL